MKKTISHFNQVFQIQKRGPLKSSRLSSWDVSANMTPHLISAIVRNQLREHDAKPAKAAFFRWIFCVCFFKDVGISAHVDQYPTKRVHKLDFNVQKGVESC